MSRRILFVVDSLFPLGAAMQLGALARELAERNHFDIHVAVLAQHSPAEWCGKFAGGTVHHLRKIEQRDAGMPLRLRRLVQRLNPEILHSWGDLANQVSGVALFQLDPCRFICTEDTRCSPKSFLESAFSRRGQRRPEKFAVSHELLRQAVIEDGVREHRLTVIPNGITSASFGRPFAKEQLCKRLNIDADAWIAGTYSELEPRSRIKDLVWAADLLACVHKNFQFVVLGKGKQLWRLKKFLSQTEALQNVHFLEHPDDAELVLTGLDVYWNSHFRRPLCPVLLRAMASEIPVVSVYGSGTSEVIEPQLSGLATNLGARDEFARWTKYLIDRNADRNQLVRQAKEWVEERFPITRVIDGYLSLYNWCE